MAPNFRTRTQKGNLQYRHPCKLCGVSSYLVPFGLNSKQTTRVATHCHCHTVSETKRDNLVSKHWQRTVSGYDNPHRRPPSWSVSLLFASVSGSISMPLQFVDLLDVVARRVNESVPGLESPDGSLASTTSFLRLPHPRTGPFLSFHKKTCFAQQNLPCSVPFAVSALSSRHSATSKPKRLGGCVGDSGGAKRVATKPTVLVLHRG